MAWKLPTVAEIEAERKGKPLLKGASRLQQSVEAAKLTTVTEKDFKRGVWERDKSICRWCQRKVIKTLERIPERGDVHHIHGRGKDLRFEVRAAVLLCTSCHEKVTGRVDERWVIHGKEFFLVRDRECIDATHPISFERVA